MKLNKIAATAAMAGALGSAALGIGAGMAQADPNVPGPGPNVPGPNVPGPNVPGQGRYGVPPPGQYNNPVGYGLPPTWSYNGQEYPLVYNPGANAWGVNASDGFHVYTPVGGAGGQVGGGGGIQPGR